MALLASWRFNFFVLTHHGVYYRIMPPVDRTTATLTGLALGDALGTLTRGMSGPDIFRRFGLYERMVAELPAGPIRTSNLTLQAIAVESHIVRGLADGVALMADLAATYDPERYCHPATRAVIESARAGGDAWRAVAAATPNDGADAAVRTAIVGLREADADELNRTVKVLTRPTHPDAIAIEGAQLLARATRLAAEGAAADRKQFLTTLLESAKSDDYRWALKTALKLKRSDSIAVLGNHFDAGRSVVTAIACFAATPDDFGFVLGRAVGLGGATDTLGAMAGLLVGAAGGLAALPVELAQRLDPQVVR